jgi:hypothetical protein
VSISRVDLTFYFGHHLPRPVVGVDEPLTVRIDLVATTFEDRYDTRMRRPSKGKPAISGLQNLNNADGCGIDQCSVERDQAPAVAHGQCDQMVVGNLKVV